MTIRKVERNRAEIGALSLFADLDDPTAGGSVADSHRQAAVLSRLAEGLGASLASEARLHGWRVQSMFESMILGLGEVRLLASEDEGDCYFDDTDGAVKLPDFRLVTRAGEHLLVEVKNVEPNDTDHALRSRDLDALKRYAGWTAGRLVLAHYWSVLNQWTLVDAEVPATSGAKAVLSLEEAMKRNELGLLGDRMIATIPPLVLSLHPSQPVALEGTTADFTIGRVEIQAAGRALNTKLERTIAFQLMLFGGWQLRERSSLDSEGRLVRHEYELRPYQPDDVDVDQEFWVVTSLSSLHAARYTISTLDPGGEFKVLRVEPEPGALAALIPADYWDRPYRGLRLSTFQVHPADPQRADD